LWLLIVCTDKSHFASCLAYNLPKGDNFQKILLIIVKKMGNKESNESAAVKRQAEGGTNPMYSLLDLSGKIFFLHIVK